MWYKLQYSLKVNVNIAILIKLIQELESNENLDLQSYEKRVHIKLTLFVYF